MTMDFSAERLSYEKGQLIESNVPNNPKKLFQQWVQTALNEQVVEPYAMSVATCGNDGLPSVRTLLMREVTELANNQFGIVFYSNYDSQKGEDIAQNPNAQVLFFWHSLERQVRISGKVRKLNVEQSTEYFHKRPKDSQIAAWVSVPQSGVVANREVMEAKFDELKTQYADEAKDSNDSKESSETNIPKPEYWGGYELVVTDVEFWQGRENRMHDRIIYRQAKNAECENAESENNNWTIERLLP